MPAYVPLLHVAETVVRVTVLDGRALAIGALLLAIAVALIWAPRESGRRAVRARRVRSRQGLVRGVVLGLALLAVLPSVLPYDHLLVTAHAGHEETHELHCHGAPGSCADAPLPSGPGQMLGADPLIVVPAMLSLALLLVVLPLRGVTRPPELRPPLRAASI
jgi:hypothetical protein